MCKYETVILLRPNLSEDDIGKVKTAVENKINTVGKIIKKEDIGIKKLAYEIQENKEAYYVIYEYETDKSPKESVDKIEKFYKKTEEILKFITVRED